MTLNETGPSPSSDMNEDRRKFLTSCGKFAVVTPPAITMLLSTSLNSPAVAQSGGRGHEHGHGRWDDCDPGDRRPGRH